MRFQATLLLSGKTATGIQVPDEVVVSLGTSKKPPVRVTLNDYTYRSTVASMGGKFMIPVSSEHRVNAGLSAGDIVDVRIELDLEPREVEIPADFSEALDRSKAAKQFFEQLSYSKKRWFILQIESAKMAETRLRRIEKAIEMLKEGRTP